MTVHPIPRGLRVNNPLNIKKSFEPWKGKVTPSRDPVFETFDTMEYGIRAGAKILLTYYDRYKLHTIKQIITRWAPKSENDTEAYIDWIAKETDIDADAQLELHDSDELIKLVTAMIRFEQGIQPIPYEQIQNGVFLAMRKA